MGEVAAYTWVDVSDYECVTAEATWRLARRGYAYHHVGAETKLHRFILGMTPEDPLVDHRDRNPLNNRRSNLRVCTVQQNSTNQGSRGGASRYRGVFWEAKPQKWRAAATLQGKKHHIGLFTDEDEAGEAARLWRIEHMPFSTEEVPA